MTNLERYNKVFMEVFELDSNRLGEELTYQSIPEWDSVGHMQLVAGLEDEFDIMFETDDIIDFNSFEMGKELLKKYGIEI